MALPTPSVGLCLEIVRNLRGDFSLKDASAPAAEGVTQESSLAELHWLLIPQHLRAAVKTKLQVWKHGEPMEISADEEVAVDVVDAQCGIV